MVLSVIELTELNRKEVYKTELF